MYSPLQRLRSLRHRFWLGVSERVCWSRGAFRETPALSLPALPVEQSRRIGSLRDRYRVSFESRLSARTSLGNYEYLDILDRAWPRDVPREGAARLCDVGCASFWYLAALDAFFRPRELIGVDVEGYRLFKDGRTRSDYAAGYVAQRPHARFVVADYCAYEQSADLITAWFPFLTPAAILAWRLPLELLQPRRLIERIHHNLSPRGRFLMVNHGAVEAQAAHALCIAAGLVSEWQAQGASILSCGRGLPPLLSCWRHPR